MDPDLKMPQLFLSPLRVLSIHRRKPERFVTFRPSQDLMCEAVGPELRWSLASFNRQNATHGGFSRRLPNWEKDNARKKRMKFLTSSITFAYFFFGSRLSKIKGLVNWCIIPLETIRSSHQIFLKAIIGTLNAISKVYPKWKWVSILTPALSPGVMLGLKQSVVAANKKEPRKVSLNDMVGIDAIKYELKAVISILQGKSNKKLGPELLDGILLYGSRGTGKTTLVHALAREAGVSFFPVSAKDIANNGTGSLGIKRLFVEARTYSPSIVFIENLDIIAKKGTSVSDPSLCQLDLEIESCKEDGSMVMVIFSTNKPKTLDLTLMNSFLFFKKVHMGLPDEDSRRQIASVHLDMVVREEDKEVICNLIASRTPGRVWADIQSIANESRRNAHNRGVDHVTLVDVHHALGMLNINDFED